MKTLARTAVTLLVALIAASPGVALIGETPTIRAVAVVRTGASNVETVALIDDTALNLRTVNKENGALAIPDQVVMLPEGAAAVDVIFSTAFRPNSVLVLREDLSVLEYPVAFDADSQPKLVGTTPTIHGPFGDPATIGFGTALAEAPGV